MSNFFDGEKRIILYVLFMLLGVFLSASVFFGIELYQLSQSQAAAEVEKAAQKKVVNNRLKKQAEIESVFAGIDVDAEAFYVFDLEKQREMYSKNKDKRFGVASLTKIATTDVYLENTKEDSGEVATTLEDRRKVIMLKKNLAKTDNHGLVWGEDFDGRELAKIMMMASSNDAASALTNGIGESVFIKKMNMLVETLGLGGTLFFSETGLDVNADILGSYSTASDVVKLVSYFYKKYPELSAELSVDRASVCSKTLCHDVENTNALLFEKEFCVAYSEENGDECVETAVERYPYKVLFSKTGYTEKAGGSLAMVVEISGREILLVVLGSGKESRFDDIKNLSGVVEKYLQIQ